MVDLRKDKRAPASLKVKYKSATVDQFMEQFGTDVSRGGIFIKTKKPIEIGALLKLELQLADASPVIHGIGRVCWRREPGPDPSLPAGMGIKFIKLDPGSRSIVDRIIHSRGGRPSRFDQTEGAEIAPPSTPPPSANDSDSRPTTRPPPSAPRPGVAPPPPAKLSRPASPGAAAVAGLFADSTMARGAAPAPSPFAGRSSFFPDAAPDNGGPGAVSAPPRVRPPVSAPAPPKPPAVKPAAGAAARAEQARHSGEFLATAFAEGGLAKETARPRPAGDAPKGGEDRLIDRLFADVIQPSARGDEQPSRDSSGVDDVFAALGEEEGLSGHASPNIAPPAPPPLAPGRRTQPGRQSDPGRSSDPGRQRQSGRHSQPGLVDPPVRRSEEDSVDDLFARLDDGPRKSSSPPASGGRVSRPELSQRAAVATNAEWDEQPGAQDSELPIDVPMSSVPPAPPAAPQYSSAPPPSAFASLRPVERRPPLLIGIVLGVLVLGGAGAFFFFQQRSERSSRPGAGAALPAVAPEPGAAPPSSAPTAAAAAAEPAAAAKPVVVGSGQPVPAGAIEIEITSVPRGADVLVDGKLVGTAPLHVALAKGRDAKITVSSTGYTPMTKWIAPSAGTEPLRFKLEPLPYELLVRTVPAEAELSVDGSTAIAPGPLALGHLDGGVQVSVAKPGFQRMTRPVRLDEFVEKDGMMRAEIEVRLSPLPGAASSAAPAPSSADEPARPRSRRSRSARSLPAPPPAPEATPEPPAAAPIQGAPEAAPAPSPAPSPSAPPTPPALPDLPPDVAAPK